MFIDSTNGNVTVWLAKFPAYLSQKILDLETETKLGKIEVDKSNISLTLSTCLDSLPNEYKVKFTDITKHMYVLKSDNRICKIEGRINKECNIIPVINKQYVEFKKASAKVEKKFSRVFSAKDVTFEKNRNEIETMAKRRKKLLMDKKRERLDRGEVMDIIFKAYEKNNSWTAKDLADLSGQPIAYINEILPDICIMNKVDQRNSWYLKDEYQMKKK
ncbi:hypothetical protein COBT_001657 [Conglomerata obtusa]